MVLDDVAHRTRLLVVRRAPFDPEILGDGDLHALHVVAIPQRLEHRVRESEDEQVLDGLLAEVVVDAVDLRLVEVLVNELIQRLGATAGRGRTASR